MAKDAYYFSHDSNAFSDPKIIRLRSSFGLEGYGFYWAIIEMLRNEENYMLKYDDLELLSYHTQTDESKIKQMLSKCLDINLLSETDDGSIYSDSLLRRMGIADEIRNKRVEAGRKGGKAKAKLKQTPSKPVALKESKGKETKLKETKEEEKIEKARVEFEDLCKPLFISLDGMSEYANFCDYWTTQNKLNDTLRFQEDDYFNMSVKVRGWLDKANKGKPTKTVTVQKAEGFE